MQQRARSMLVTEGRAEVNATAEDYGDLQFKDGVKSIDDCLMQHVHGQAWLSRCRMRRVQIPKASRVTAVEFKLFDWGKADHCEHCSWILMVAATWIGIACWLSSCRRQLSQANVTDNGDTINVGSVCTHAWGAVRR